MIGGKAARRYRVKVHYRNNVIVINLSGKKETTVTRKPQ